MKSRFLFIRVALFSAVLVASLNFISAAADDDRTSPVIVTEFGAQQSGDTWTACLAYKNVGSRPIRAVEFKVVFFDAFDEELASVLDDSRGLIAPASVVGPGKSNSAGMAPSDNCWDSAVAAGNVDRVTVEIMKVRFEDGQIVNFPTGDGKRALFSGHYLAPLQDHPDKVKCWLGLSYDWDFAQTVPACAGAIKKWKAGHRSVDDQMQSSPQEFASSAIAAPDEPRPKSDSRPGAVPTDAPTP